MRQGGRARRARTRPPRARAARRRASPRRLRAFHAPASHAPAAPVTSTGAPALASAIRGSRNASGAFPSRRVEMTRMPLFSFGLFSAHVWRSRVSISASPESTGTDSDARGALSPNRSGFGETNMSPSGERFDISAALAALSTPTRITGGSRSWSAAPFPNPTRRGGRRGVALEKPASRSRRCRAVAVVVASRRFRLARAALRPIPPPASTTSRSPPRVATSNTGARSASPNATRIAAGAVELSSGRSSISLRNTSDANARVATEPRVSRAATAIISRAYVPATSTVTAPARTSPAVMASLLTAPRNEAPVSGSGKVKHDGSCANRTMDTGSSWSVSAAW